MKLLVILSILMISMTPSLKAETAYIDDQIKIWTRTGPSEEFKVKYKIAPGTQFVILQRNDETGYVEIQETNGRTSWLKSEYISKTPTAHKKFDDATKTIGSLKETYTEKVSTLEKQIRELQPLRATNDGLQSELSKLQTEFEQVRQEKQVYEGRFNTEVFFSGAVVFFAGMIFGWVLTKVGKRNKGSGWS